MQAKKIRFGLDCLPKLDVVGSNPIARYTFVLQALTFRPVAGCKLPLVRTDDCGLENADHDVQPVKRSVVPSHCTNPAHIPFSHLELRLTSKVRLLRVGQKWVSQYCAIFHSAGVNQRICRLLQYNRERSLLSVPVSCHPPSVDRKGAHPVYRLPTFNVEDTPGPGGAHRHGNQTSS